MLTVNDVEVASLDRALEWCHKFNPKRVVIHNTSRVVMDHGLVWDYAPINGLHFVDGWYDGNHGGKANLSWAFAFQPKTKAGPIPAYTPITMTGVKWSGFLRGGVNISPAVEGNVADGGHTGWMTGIKINKCLFQMFGSRYGQDNEETTGLAAIFLKGVVNAEIKGCRFKNLINDPITPGTHGGVGMIHAVYAQNSVTHMVVSDCVFENVSGDPIRLRDGSSAVILNNHSMNSGDTAMASDWHRKEESPSILLSGSGNSTTTLYNSTRKSPFWVVASKS